MNPHRGTSQVLSGARRNGHQSGPEVESASAGEGAGRKQRRARSRRTDPDNHRALHGGGARGHPRRYRRLHALQAAHAGRKQIVFGVGNPKADLMFVGEAPGAEEDNQGDAVRRTRRAAADEDDRSDGLQRATMSTSPTCSNAVRRQPQSRTGRDRDLRTVPFRQLASVEPKVVIALGASAARTLLRTDAPISRLRGRVFD